MDITVECLQGFWDDAWDAAPAGANSLRQQLRSYESAASSQFRTSGTLVSVGKNSAHQTYRGPGVGSYTIAQIQTAWRALINLYDWSKQVTDCLQAQAVAWFIAKYPTYQQDPDPAVYARTACWLRNDFTSNQIDLSELRLQPTATGLTIALETW